MAASLMPPSRTGWAQPDRIATRPRDMAHNPEMAFVNTAARQDAVGAMVQQALEAGAPQVASGFTLNAGLKIAF